MNPNEAARSLFEEKFSKQPKFLVRSPGRVNLLGEHTDYNLGFVLPMAIEQGTYLAFTPRKDSLLKVYSSLMEEWIEADFSEPLLKTVNGHWSNYLIGVAAGLTRKWKVRLGGLNAVIFNNLPAGASLSSSASLELAFARALWRLQRRKWNGLEAAKLCQRAEQEFAGVSCGIMDQLACSVTEKENALFLDCKDLDYSYAPIPTDVSVAILDSGTRRKLSDGRYNTRRNECEQAALILGVRTLRSLNRDTLEKNVDALRDFQYLRALHVLDENERVNRAFLALKKGAITTVGKLMDEGHWSLRELFEVSTDNLDWLVNIARDQKGCLGARMTGAGFGGCAVALVKKDQAENFAARVPKIYLEKTGKRGSIFFTRPVDGCSLEE